jgi:hypothetical protein
MWWMRSTGMPANQNRAAVEDVIATAVACCAGGALLAFSAMIAMEGMVEPLGLFVGGFLGLLNAPLTLSTARDRRFPGLAVVLAFVIAAVPTYLGTKWAIRASVPVLYVAVGTAELATLFALAFVYWIMPSKIPGGFCQTCAYDLRGHDCPKRCPECGQLVEPATYRTADSVHDRH